MMRWLIESSMKLRFLIIVLAAVIIGAGIWQLRQMPVDVYPEFDPPYVEVQTEALGLSADEVESLITVPLEADLLNGVAWLDQIYSESVDGLSSILLVFEPGTDPIRARQMVQERLTQAHALPNVSKPPVMLQPLSSTSRTMIVALTSEEVSPIEMGVLARWIVKPRLMGVPGVANVAVWGQRERQLQVLVDPEELHAADVSLDQIIETTGEALWVSPLTFLESSTPGTAGWIDTPNQRLGLRHLLPISTAEDLAKVVVADTDGVLLGDVTEVVEDHQPLIGDAILDEGTAGVLLVIEKFPNANTLEVTQGVDAALEALRPGLGGIEINSNVFRPANYIEAAAANLGRLLLIGAVIMLIVLLLFFFNWRTALISSIVIPLSLIAATYVLYLRGESFNMMILAGLTVALGVIVDDAIIDVEHLARRLRERGAEDGGEARQAAMVDAILEMRNPIGYATLMLLAIVLPIFFIGGLTEAFFQPFVQSYVLAVLVSLLVALIVTPALSLTLLANSSATRRISPVARAVQGGYRWMLAPIVRFAPLMLVIALIAIVAGAVLAATFDVSLVPTFRQTDLLIRWDAVPGTSHGEMNRITAQVGEELRALPGVNNVGSHVGRAVTGDAIVSINSGEIWVNMDPTADYDATVAAVQDVVAGYPGVFRQVQTYQPDGTNTVLTQPEQDLVVRIYGHEIDVLTEKAEEISQVLASTPGVTDVQADLQTMAPQVEIAVDLEQAEEHGIKPGEVRRQATTLVSGIYVGNLFEEQKVFDVVVWGTPEIRENLTNLENLMIDLPSGEQTPLKDLADVRIAPAPMTIKRDAVSRYLDVTANFDGARVNNTIANIESALANVELPFEYHTEMLVDPSAQPTNQWRLWTVVALALGAIFLLMQSAFSSWRLALVVFLTMPMALVGGVVAIFLNGGVLSLGAIFGLLAILGIALRSGMVLVSHLHHLEDVEGQQFGADLVLQGAVERAAPILMTALVTAGGILPIALAGDMAGTELLRPLALVLLGGLVTTLLLTLFVAPALYLRFGARPAPAPAKAPAAEQPQLGMA